MGHGLAANRVLVAVREASEVKCEVAEGTEDMLELCTLGGRISQ